VTPAGVVTQFPAGANGPLPYVYDVIAGPDGNMWYDALDPNQRTVTLGRMTPTGAVTLIPMPSDAGSWLVAGPDGAIWCPGATTLHRVTTDGVVQTFTSPYPINQMAKGTGKTFWGMATDSFIRVTVN
jgi:virginiamycin B lyase